MDEEERGEQEEEERKFEVMSVEVLMTNGAKIRIIDEKFILESLLLYYELRKKGKISIYSPFTGRKYVFNVKEVSAMVLMYPDDQMRAEDIIVDDSVSDTNDDDDDNNDEQNNDEQDFWK